MVATVALLASLAGLTVDWPDAVPIWLDSLRPDEVEALEREAKEKRVSEAEVLRRALRAYLDL